ITSSTRARRREAGEDTVVFLRPIALRMRVSISPSGSFIDMSLSSLPARLDEARDKSLATQFAQSNSRHLELAVVGARTARYVATVSNARLRGIARKGGKLK